MEALPDPLGVYCDSHSKTVFAVNKLQRQGAFAPCHRYAPMPGEIKRPRALRADAARRFA
jgi:hypothetical protein